MRAQGVGIAGGTVVTARPGGREGTGGTPPYSLSLHGDLTHPQTWPLTLWLRLFRFSYTPHRPGHRVLSPSALALSPSPPFLFLQILKQGSDYRFVDVCFCAGPEP